MELLRKRRVEDRACEGARILRLVPREDTVEPRTLDAPSKEDVRRAVADLPCAQRDVVALCELVGMSIKEASEVLGWGESRVKVTLFRARRRLREMLTSDVANSAEGACSD